jgi:hypothetical protein
MKGVGLPYMGSKRKLAGKIVDTILRDQGGKIERFYDLFGGGGSVSFAALSRPSIGEVYYNEINAGVVSLLRKIIAEGGCRRSFINGLTEKRFSLTKTTKIGSADCARWSGVLGTIRLPIFTLPRLPLKKSCCIVL